MSGGGPAYKPQEDYYDEIIELKKVPSMHSCCFDSHSYTLQRSSGESARRPPLWPRFNSRTRRHM